MKVRSPRSVTLKNTGADVRRRRQEHAALNVKTCISAAALNLVKTQAGEGHLTFTSSV